MANYTSKYGLLKYNNYLKNKLQSPEAIIANLGIKESTKLGVELGNLLVNCSFGKQMCSLDQFHLFQYNRFYNCYTHKSDVDSTSLIAGPEEGLSMMLYKVCILNNTFYQTNYMG